MYINEITVKHSAEYFWCQRANKAAFKDVVSSPSTSLLCTSHQVVTQSCLIKIFRSLVPVNRSDLWEASLSSETTTNIRIIWVTMNSTQKKQTCFPERLVVITKLHKLMSHKNSPRSTSSYECVHRPGLLVKSCTETTGLAHSGVQPPRPHIKLCAQCEQLPLKGVAPSSSLQDQITSGRCEHETPHRQMYRYDFRDNSATVDSIYRLSSFWFLMLFQDLDLVFLCLQR